MLMPIRMQIRLSDLTAIQIRVLPQVLHKLENHKICFDFFLFTSVPVYIVYLSSQRDRFQKFQYFGKYIEGFLEKKVFLSLIFR
jgi:hypothetical protein